MFSDAFGEKYFLCDERHGAGVGASVNELRAKILPLWKSNKKVLQCQFISRTFRAKKERDESTWGPDRGTDERYGGKLLTFDELFGGDVLQQFTEGFGER